MTTQLLPPKKFIDNLLPEFIQVFLKKKEAKRVNREREEEEERESLEEIFQISQIIILNKSFERTINKKLRI